MTTQIESLLVLQAAFGGVLFLMGLMMFLFMQSLSIVILYIAVAILTIVYGLTQLLASLVTLAKKAES